MLSGVFRLRVIGIEIERAEFDRTAKLERVRHIGPEPKGAHRGNDPQAFFRGNRDDTAGSEDELRPVMCVRGESMPRGERKPQGSENRFLSVWRHELAICLFDDTPVRLYCRSIDRASGDTSFLLTSPALQETLR